MAIATMAIATMAIATMAIATMVVIMAIAHLSRLGVPIGEMLQGVFIRHVQGLPKIVHQYHAH
jgi:hypothetical protein